MPSRSRRKKLKIHPLIPIILLAIVIIIIGYSLIKGFIFNGKGVSNFQVSDGGAFCSPNEEGVNTIKITALNTGYQADLYLDVLVEIPFISKTGSFNLREIDGELVPSLAEGRGNGFQGGSIKPGETGLLIEYDCGTGGCTPGEHKIDLGTIPSVYHSIVECP